VKPVPAGAGLVVRHVRLAKGDVAVLGALLSGEDHLASIHGEPDALVEGDGAPVVVAVLTTEARAAELDDWLDALAAELGLERVPG
jgi:hypothetical protein